MKSISLRILVFGVWWMRAVYVMACLLAFLAFASLWLYANLQALQASNEELRLQLQDLNFSYQLYKDSHKYTNEEHHALLANYTKLSLDYQKLQRDYERLELDYEALESRYEKFVASYGDLVSKINLRWDGSNVMIFVTPNDPSVKDLVYRITGGWSDPTDFSEFWRDVKAMFTWITENIDYRFDGLYPALPPYPWGEVKFQNEVWQFPNETIELMMGDCEDQAILLCSMIRCYTNMKYMAECIWITSSKHGHIGVQIPVSGDKIVILDPAGHYYTHDALGNIVPRDIRQEINNWLNYWRPEMGSDVRVYRVFSDYLDVKFESTSEYLQWMYNRV